MTELEELKARIAALEALVQRVVGIVEKQGQQIDRLLGLIERIGRLQ